MLRKMALRKLFASETYNERDGLDEYDGDYTHFEKLDPTTITADMKHMIRVEAERLQAKLLEEDRPPQQLAEDAEVENMELAAEHPDETLLATPAEVTQQVENTHNEHQNDPSNKRHFS
jgi:hypothetical protein